MTTTKKLTKQARSALAAITTRTEAGRHFTEEFPESVIQILESQGLIEVHRPVHPATEIPYACECWSVEVTPTGLAVIRKGE